MRNIAKCKLCESVIESFHSTDYVECKCGEIAVDAGEALKCFVKTSWDNFLRVDEKGNTIKVSVDEAKPTDEIPVTDPREQIEYFLQRLKEMPQAAMSMPLNHYDLINIYETILSVIK